MQPFLGPDVLLDTPAARRLYHEHAALQPIIDYHTHLNPRWLAEDHRFSNLWELWLAEDHYKWRALRANGVAERLITGDATPREKFQAWAETVPRCLRSPLYHWTHLELKKPFGIDRLLDGRSAEAIWSGANARLGEAGFSARGLLANAGYEAVCTTDDPADPLVEHQACATAQATGALPFRVLPTWRPDRALGIDDPVSWNAWRERLGAAAGLTIETLDDLREALRHRHGFFHQVGCRLSDHGLETVYADDWSEHEIQATFTTVRRGAVPDPQAISRFRSCLLYEGAVLDHAAGWVQQFHLGPIRNLNTRLAKRLGADAGCDAIGDASHAKPLARFLDRLDRTDQLAKTILYNIHTKDAEVLACLANTFQDGRTPGKIQYGSAWWFHDQLDGMSQQLDVLSNLGLLSRFVGMLTDSRSFTSFSRHEWFRRLLCAKLGQDMERGLMPDDLGLVGGMVEDLCYRNAREYFGLVENR